MSRSIFRLNKITSHLVTFSSSPWSSWSRQISSPTYQETGGVRSLELGSFKLAISAVGISKALWKRGRWGKVEAKELAGDDLDKERTCGEDAFLVNTEKTANKNNNFAMVSVADGVGGWAEEGIDPGLVSHRLLELLHLEGNNFRLIFQKESSSSSSNLFSASNIPLSLLDQAFQKLENENNLTGSTTTCLGIFEPISLSTHLRLHILNVGDSGVIVIRNSTIFRVSLSQQHPNGAPYQLGVIGSELRHKYQTGLSDRPKNGTSEIIDLERGDILIFATDGFLDNMNKKKVMNSIILPVLSQFKSSNGVVENEVQSQLIQTIAKRALVEATKGPKVDDITVVAVSVL